MTALDQSALGGFLNFDPILSRFLGDISFPLYLVQFAVLVSLTSGLVIRFVDPAHSNRLTLYGIAAVSILVSIVLAWLFAGVERQVLRWPTGWSRKHCPELAGGSEGMSPARPGHPNVH